MSFLNVIALVVIVGYVVISKTPNMFRNKTRVVSPGQVISEQSSRMTPVPSATPKPTSTSVNIDQKSRIDIDVDTNIGKSIISLEKIIYPQAVQISTTAEKDIYQTQDAGETVYNWYQQELLNRGFQIRNNVKTRANDKFMAVLQAILEGSMIKVTVDQESLAAKTVITLE